MAHLPHAAKLRDCRCGSDKPTTTTRAKVKARLALLLFEAAACQQGSEVASSQGAHGRRATRYRRVIGALKMMRMGGRGVIILSQDRANVRVVWPRSDRLLHAGCSARLL